MRTSPLRILCLAFYIQPSAISESVPPDSDARRCVVGQPNIMLDMAGEWSTS